MTFPAITPNSMQISSVNPTRITSTLNGTEQRLSGTGQYFRFLALFDNLSQADARKIFAHINQYRGSLDAFALSLPTYLANSTAGYSGNITGATASIGATSITGTVGVSGAAIVKAGDMIKIGTGNKLYTVTSDATASGTTVTINFTPGLRVAVSNGGVFHRNLTAWVRYANDNQEFNIGTNLYNTASIDFVEVL